jgi:outer membrane protein TolC
MTAMRGVEISTVRFLGRLTIFSAAAWAAGCAVGPDYHRPAADVPPAWQPEAPWHEAAPSDAALKGRWWQVFQDSALDPLVEQALLSNQNLHVAAARLEQARSQVTVARSYLYPDVGLQASAARSTKPCRGRPDQSRFSSGASSLRISSSGSPIICVSGG